MIVYDNKNININGKNEHLCYRKRIYEKNSEHKRIKINEKNRRVSSKKIDNEIYYLTEIIDTPLETRINTIEKIFKTPCKENRTLEEEIEFLWETKYCFKSQNDNLNDFCSKTLETLADYYIAGFEGENILDQRRWEQIRKYEVASLVENMTDDIADAEEERVTTINVLSKQQRKKRDKQNVGQTKRWKNSLTRAMDRIYTYDNTEEIEEWILDTKVKIKPRIPVKYERLINPKEPFRAEWCRVDVDGYFSFNNKCWQVKDKAYKCNPLADKGFVQDKILCYEQYNKYYFFDMNINGLKEVKEVIKNG